MKGKGEVEFQSAFASPIDSLWVNDVRFVISKEEALASGPGTMLDHSRAFV